MARSGVYRTDVEKVRRALLAQGKHPSIDLVRAALGNTGSRSTIHRLLKEIEAEGAAPQGTKVAVSDAIQALVERLSVQLHEEADTRIAEDRAASDAQVREHHARAQTYQTEVTELRDALQHIETTLAAERASHQETAGQLQQARVQLAQWEERLAAHERRSREQDAHLTSLEEKHRQARDALEHFRTAAQEQRGREQRLHEQAMQALQVELRTAVDQLTGKNAELLQLNRDNGRLVEQSTHLQQTLRTAERELDLARDERDTLRPLPAQIKALESQTARAIVHAEALQQTLAETEGRLERMRGELHAAQMDQASTAAKLEGMHAVLAQQRSEPVPP
jgi:chromosome segregation ATPase